MEILRKIRKIFYIGINSPSQIILIFKNSVGEYIYMLLITNTLDIFLPIWQNTINILEDCRHNSSMHKNNPYITCRS